MQKVEEEGMDSSGFIPEANRAVMTLCEVDRETKSVRLGCRFGSAESQLLDGPKYREEVLPWDFPITPKLGSLGYWTF